MKIGYVMIRKKQIKENWLAKTMEYIKYKFFDIFNIVEQDKYHKNIFRITNFTKQSKEKLITKISAEKIDYVLVENNKMIPYIQLEGIYLIKYMIPEIVDQCYKAIEPSKDEIYVCTNIFNNENVELINELISKVKVVNIITSNRNYYKLEKQLEEKEIYITVSSNKRKCLKNAVITINLDFDNFADYNINRNMVIIDATGIMDIPKSFNGIVIKKVEVATKRVLRIFGEFEGFDKSKLIEAEMLKLGDYAKIRNYIHMGEIYISGLYNKRKIQTKDFRKIKKYKILAKTI